MQNWQDFFQKNKIYISIFAVIFVVGIALRVYGFKDFLIFGFDQARDATLTSNIIEKHQGLPLLGPHAMGTRFKVGPIYYYFQYISVLIFGNEPKNLAYPDLFFSILTIPLLLIFLRKYFDKKTSLALTGLWSVSFFTIKFARFAWNPNSLPFFVLLLLYALLELADKEKKKKKNLWLVVAGATLGVGVQLHTLSFLILPIVTVVFLWFKLGGRQIKLRYIGAIFAVAIVFNIPQVISEIETRGGNTKAFVIGVEEQLKIHTDVTADFLTDIYCHAQANSMVVSSFGNNANCSFVDLLNKNKANGGSATSAIIMLMRIILSFIFSILSYGALYYFSKKEKIANRQNFLNLIGLFVGVSFLMFFPLANEVTDRYYLIFAFIPIVLLGLLYDYLRKKTQYASIIATVILAILVLQNGITLKKYFTPFRSIGLMEDSMLSENQALADFIVSNVGDQKTAYIDQRQGDWRVLNYFLGSKVSLMGVSKNTGNIDKAIPYFIITDRSHSDIGEQIQKQLGAYQEIKQASFGVFVVTVLKTN